MIGISCQGEEHARRVRDVLDRIGYRAYMLLRQARQIVEADMFIKVYKGYDTSYESNFLENVAELLQSQPQPGDSGEVVMVWVDVEGGE